MRFLSFVSGVLRAGFWICLLFALDRPYLAILSLLSMLFHELFHVLAFMLLSKNARFRTHVSGLRLLPHGTLSYKEERFIALAGPIGGGIGALTCFVFYPLAPEYLADFVICHLLTSLSNLLPIEGYDGYRALKATLALHGNTDPERMMRALSFAFTAALALLSLCFFGILGQGLWPAGAFLFTLIGALPERKNAIFENS